MRFFVQHFAVADVAAVQVVEEVDPGAEREDAKVHGADEAAGALGIFYMAAGFQGGFFCFAGGGRVVAFVVGGVWFVGHCAF